MTLVEAPDRAPQPLACFAIVRLVVAECAIEYAGRLRASLPAARRLIIVKDDGTVIVHSDKGHKALNWMSPPCVIVQKPTRWLVTGSKGETLEISIDEIHSDTEIALGFEPGLSKFGSEDELQALLAASPEVIEPGSRLITREHRTDVGPIDLLLTDPAGGTIVVEVKRVAEIDAVDQLLRYLERLTPDSSLQPTRGILVAQRIKPQTRVYAESKGIATREVDFDSLAGLSEPGLTLF